MKLYFRLLKFVIPYWKLILSSAIFMVFLTIFDGFSLGMLVPLSDKVLNNKPIILPQKKIPAVLNGLILKINHTQPLHLLGIIAILAIFVIIMKGIFYFSQAFLMNGVSQKVIRDVRDKLYSKIQYMSLDFFSKEKVGNLVSRLTYDVIVIRHAISEGFADLVYYSLQLILFLTIIIFINWKLSLILFFLIPTVGFPLLRMGKLLRKISKKTQEKMGDLNSRMYETFSGMNIVKAFSMEKEEIKKFKILNRDFYKLMMKTLKRTLAIAPATEFIAGLGGVTVLVVGGREVINGTMSFGVFMLYLASLLSLMKPVKRLIKVYNLNQISLAAAKRIFELLDEVPTIKESPNAKELPYPKDKIVYEDVWFKYEENYVLKGINLEVKIGEIVCLVGPSGVGKTTLVNLLLRFYDSTKGRILIDGIDIKEVKISSLRKYTGLVTQEPVLFNDTVKANISYGMKWASDKDVEEAAKLANAHEFIIKLPKGYDTFVGDRGFKLSGGERQRIAVARALLKDPPILILDEATAQLDAASEVKVQEAIERLIRGRTVFLIAHRLSTARRAQRIIVLDEGKIVEEGSHDELIGRKGLYHKYYEMQFQV
jgi:subfamily B ATP-binding cassette protein MsbA